MFQCHGAGFAAGVENGGCERAVRAEGHSIVVEFCARVQFVDSGLDGGFPYLKTDFDRQFEKFVEGGSRSFEGFEECMSCFPEGVLV